MRLILLHGLGQSAESWHEVVKNINLQEVTVFPLFEDIPPTVPVNLDSLNRKLEVDLKGISEPFILGGLSLGAVLTLRFATESHPLLKGIVVAAGQFEAPDEKIMAFQKSVFKLMPPALLKKSGLDLEKPQILQLMKEMSHLDLRYSLRQIEVPTLLLCGAKDRANLPATNEMSGLLPKATTKIIRNGKHELNRSSPDAFAAEVNKFIENILESPFS